MQGLSLGDVFTTLSYYMGSVYVNDFNEFGKIYQVKMSAQASARSSVDDVLKLSVRNDRGEMVPFSSFTEIEEFMGLNLLTRYNLYSSASITCIQAQGVSSAQCIRSVENLIDRTLGNNFSYSWTGEAYQETEAGTSVTIIFGLAILIVFLVLAAQYESWSSPVAVLLSLPTAILGTVIGCMVMGQSIGIYTQIGIVLLIAPVSYTHLTLPTIA